MNKSTNTMLSSVKQEKSKNKFFGVIWRSLFVGAAYAGILGLTNSLFSRGIDTRSLVGSFAGGTVISLTLGPLASSMAATWSRHMFVWGSVIFLNIASVTIEGRFFAPDLVRGSMFVLLVRQLLIAVITTWLLVKLFAPTTTSRQIPPIQRSWFSWLWRFSLSAFSYIFFYYVFGALNYLLVTGPYYQTHAGGLVVPAQETLLKAELTRAPMIVLSILPFLLTFPASKRHTAFLTGMILFLVGGLAPLLMQASALPLILLAASAVEIFLQNFLTGVVSASLLASKTSIETSP
jgi:hypothetical protein